MIGLDRLCGKGLSAGGLNARRYHCLEDET
jgi:hypothetical protein